MITVETDKENIRSIMAMFDGLPKRVSKDAVWGKFWKKVTLPMLKAVDPPVAKKDVVYPPDPTKTILRGTLKKSIQFYRTRASKQKDVHGAYIGPRVKGKFKKEKGGYYGAWVEYGHKIGHKGTMTKANPFMERAFKQTSKVVLSNGFSDAEQIFIKAVAADVRRLKKYGKLGY